MKDQKDKQCRFIFYSQFWSYLQGCHQFWPWLCHGVWWSAGWGRQTEEAKLQYKCFTWTLKSRRVQET